MPVADLKAEILAKAKAQVGPDPIGGPVVAPPRLGDAPEPSARDQLKQQILMLAARQGVAEKQGALQRFGKAGLESAAGLPGQVLEGAGTLLGSDTLESAGQAIQPELLTDDERATTAGKIGGAVGSGLGFLGTGGAGAALGLGVRGGLALTAGAAGLQNMPDAYYGALANGASPEKAWLAALTESAVVGGLEIAGPQRRVLAKVFGEADRATGGGLRALLVEGLKNAAEEGTEEGLQSLAGDLIAQKLYDVAPDEDWSAILGKAAQAAGTGAVGGGLLGVAFDGVQRYDAERVREGFQKVKGAAGAALKDAPTPYPIDERSPPVYEPAERDLTPEEAESIASWQKERGATRAEVVERPEMAEATELARKAGAEVLFVDDDGSGRKQARHEPGRIILPADADPATVGLEVATHEAIHALPLSKREALQKTLSQAFPGAVAAKRSAYADAADAEGVKASKAVLDEEATAELAGALAPVVQRIMRNPARATALMTDSPGLMVRALDIVRGWAGKTTHAEAVAKEIETLAQVRDQVAKGLTGRQRVQAAQRIVAAFDGLAAEMKRPVKPKKSSQGGEQVKDGAGTFTNGEDMPVDPALGGFAYQERGLVPVSNSDRSRSPRAAGEAAAQSLRERRNTRADRSRRLSREVSDANQPYRPGTVQLGDRQGFDDYRQLSTQDLAKRSTQAAADEAYETDLALREAGFTDRERKGYEKARRRARMAQRAMDMARTDAQAEAAREELLDSSQRLGRYEARLSPAQKARLRSTPDPEVYDRALAARQAGLEARYSDLPEGSARGEELMEEERRGMDRAVPSVRYSLKQSPGEDEYIAKIAGKDGRIPASARPNLGMGDMYGMAPKGARTVSSGEYGDLGRVRFVEKDGDVFALAVNPDLREVDVVGYAMSRENGTELAVVEEAQRRGIGQELSYQYRKRNPYAPSGGLTEAGEKTARKTYRRLVAEGILGPNGEPIRQENGGPEARYSLRSDIESAAREASEGYTLANQGKTLPERVLRTGLRNILGVQDSTTAKETSDRADAILADNEKLNDLLKRAYDGQTLNGHEQIALDRFARSEGTAAFESGNGPRMENAIQAEAEFQRARSEAGRTLGDANFRDVLQSPTDRAMKLLLTPSRQVQRRYNKAKTWQKRRAILQEEARKVEKVRFSLAQRGFDPRLLTDDYFKDPNFRQVWAESFADGKVNGKWDWYIQWRRAAMLSGPITTIRNVTGNTSYVAYDRVLRLAADSIVPGSDTDVADVREYVRDMLASMGQGWADARTAYSDFYNASTEGTSLDEQVAMRRGGVAGKALVVLEAVGVRAQAAQDIFFRTVVGSAETRLRARQKARAEGGTAEDYMHDPDVLAMAEEDMERALFLDRDKLTRAITSVRDMADRFVPVGSTLVPFAATPTKIVQRGGEALLGLIGGLMRDREKHGGALLGAATWAAMVWVATLFDDEDGLPMVTGSRAKGGEGDFQDRTAPAYSIRVGDTYYSYQSIEPLSTALASIVDAVRSGNPMESISSFLTAAKDKSFFRSVETVYDAMVGAANGERGADRAKQVARDLLWTPMVPNVVRSPLRAVDDERRKELGDPLEVEDFVHAAIPNGEFGPPLRYDLWGRPAEKAGGSWVARVLSPVLDTNEVGDVERIDLLLADYNRRNEVDKFFSAPAVFTTEDGVRQDWTEDEYATLARESGRAALERLRPWAANKTALSERDIDHIRDVLARERKRTARQLRTP